MKYEEYRKVGKHPLPYYYKISEAHHFLYYFGANHSCDPDNEQYPLIKKFWHDFLNDTRKENCLVLVEGGKRPLAQSEKEAIQAGSEGRFITHLAHQEDIPTDSPEPSPEVVYKELARGFSKDEIMYYQFAGVVYQWHRRQDKKPFEQYIQSYLERFEKETEWNDFDFSLDYMKDIHQKIFNTTFNKDDVGFFKKIVNPSLDKDLTNINKVAKTTSEIRDEYILRQIETLWHEGKNLFIVYGGSHAVMQEPALRKLV